MDSTKKDYEISFLYMQLFLLLNKQIKIVKKKLQNDLLARVSIGKTAIFLKIFYIFQVADVNFIS